MRNIWYPKKIAGYVTVANLQTTEKKNIVVERDPTFGTRKERVSIKRARAPIQIKVKEHVPTGVRAPIQKELPAEPRPIGIQVMNVRSTGSLRI
jgi:hypothetical protein